MTRIFRISFLFLMTFFITLYAEIIETNHFSEISNYVKPDTLVILDIDDTLLIPVQTLGTDVWFMHKHKQYKVKESPAIALDKALAEWEALRHLTNVKIVEEGSDKIIETMQENNVIVMGLTTQGLALATRTINQLRTLSIDLSKTAPSAEDHYFINRHGVLYRDGILFTSGTPKGPALLHFLNLIDYHPKHVVFINDKKTHLQDVENSLLPMGIDFTGLRYTYSDERVANFNPEIADVQWTHSTFDRIMSDEEAEALLAK